MMKRLVMGNEAFAYAALAAGVKVVAGYPGTPSSEVIETVAAEHAAGRAEGVYVEWSANEKVALELLAGASLAGARCLFTCKQVGLNVASDALMSLNYLGIKGGLVLFVADDPGPISSQTEQDTRRFASFAKVPVLDPSTVEEGYEMIQTAFELSEAYGTPVIVRSSTRICHASTFMDIPEQTSAQKPQGFERSSRYVIFPKRSYEAHGEVNERLLAMAEDFSQRPASRFNPIEEKFAFGNDETAKVSRSGEPATQPKLGIVAGGVSASYVLEALRMIEDRCSERDTHVQPLRFMQIGTPYPFPDALVEEFVEGFETVLVFEELDYVIEDEMVRLCGKIRGSYEVQGKLSGHTLSRGENSVDDCYTRIVEFLGLTEVFALADNVEADNAGQDKGSSLAPQTGVSARTVSKTQLEEPPLPIRPPVLCAGCPHRGSFYAVKQALKKMKEEAIFCGDIGCYTLGNAMPLDAVDTCLCMGGGITMAQGFAVAGEGKKKLAFVGDSTFFASGLPGIVNAIYNEHDITVVVVDNSITAMTGSQPNPGTGTTLMGSQHKGISIEAVLRAVGFGHIGKASPFNLKESIEVAQKAIAVDGPSAIIYKGPCITIVKPKESLQIDISCTGCRKCINEIGCPAIGFNTESNKAVISPELCTGCQLCVSICPFKAILKKGEQDA